MKYGQYETVRLLGKGGMSEVYEVESLVLGSRYALKLFSYKNDDPEVRERFLVEGKLLARFNHPRIVKVRDIGTDEDSGAPYLVLDLIVDEKGAVKSLADIAPGTIDEETIGRWYDDIRDGLDYIHNLGVIHRDLKLQNVLIGPDGHAVLTDFGVSKVTEKTGQTVVSAVETLVKVREGRSLVMGSLGYMAPELEMGVAASPQSDWYALGVLVYRLLTGTWCDSRTNITEVLETYDPVWSRIVPKLLHSNPAGRECLSYAEEKRLEREHQELVNEERLSNVSARGRAARHLMRILMAVSILLFAGVTYLVLSRDAERRLNRTLELQSAVVSPYDFDNFFSIPPNAKSDSQMDAQDRLIVPSREDLEKTRIDMWVLTYPLFVQLRSGTVTVENVLQELERMRDDFDENSDAVFDRWPSIYMQTGDDATAYWMLCRAIERLREISEQ